MWTVTRRMSANVADARLNAVVIETLESRRLLTALPGASTDVPPIVLSDGTVVEFNGAAEFKDGILTVNGQSRRNVISLSIHGSESTGLTLHFEHYVRDQDNFYSLRNVGFANIPAADLKGIRVVGSDEDDSITVETHGSEHGLPVFDIPVTLFGGGGDDTLIGGHAVDSIVGGAGRDWIEGGASRWLDREWFNQGWRGTDTLHVDRKRHFVGDDTIGGGIHGEVLDGESDGNDMPAPPEPLPVPPRPVPPGPPEHVPPVTPPGLTPGVEAKPLAVSDPEPAVALPPATFSVTLVAPVARGSLFADGGRDSLWSEPH
jgi:hypothetical protein